MDKFEALAGLNASDTASFSEAKKAFRRQAMKWHPDRNKHKDAEENFKAVRSCYDYLEHLHDSGHWDEPTKQEVHQASAGYAQAEFQNGGEHEKKPRKRQFWDPASGPMFDFGESQESIVSSGNLFFSSYFDICVETLRKGASPKMAAKILTRGLHAFLGHKSFDMEALKPLTIASLRHFWSRRQTGMFEAARCAMDMMHDLGWSSGVVEMLNPCKEIYAHGAHWFYLFEAAQSALPSHKASSADLAFYREWVASMPNLFSGFAAKERALRFAMNMSGRSMGPFWFEAILSQSPEIGVVFFPLASPSQFATKKDWLDIALTKGVPFDWVQNWFMEDKLEKACLKICVVQQKDKELAIRFAESRMRQERNWKWAGPWASPEALLLRKAQSHWEKWVLHVKPGVMGAASLALGFKKLSGADVLRRAVVFSPAQEALAAIQKTSSEHLRQVKSNVQLPLASLCALRFVFDGKISFDLNEKFSLIAKEFGDDELSKYDKLGKSPRDWFELGLALKASSVGA